MMKECWHRRHGQLELEHFEANFQFLLIDQIKYLFVVAVVQQYAQAFLFLDSKLIQRIPILVQVCKREG
jgi:hypothetical protein